MLQHEDKRMFAEKHILQFLFSLSDDYVVFRNFVTLTDDQSKAEMINVVFSRET
jgi:hypothetical protein